MELTDKFQHRIRLVEKKLNMLYRVLDNANGIFAVRVEKRIDEYKHQYHELTGQRFVYREGRN